MQLDQPIPPTYSGGQDQYDFILNGNKKTQALVDSFVASFVNPMLGLLLPGNGDLGTKTLRVSNGSKEVIFTWGAFLMQLISFVIVAAIVYYVVHGLKLDKIDKKKS